MNVRMGWPILSALIALASPGSAAEQAPSWEVAKTPDQCVLTRKVDAPEPLLIMVTSKPGSDSYDVILSATKLPPPSNPFAGMDLVLDGASKTIKVYGQSGTTSANLQALRFNEMDWTDFANLRQASALRVKYDGKTYGPFALPDVADAIGALRDCLGEHLRAMGADPAQFAPGGASPEPLKPRLQFLSTDQVMRAMKDLKGADTNFKLTIDTEGRVGTCARSTQPGGDKLEKNVCGMLAGRTLFKPGRDAAGKPVTGMATYSMPIIRVKYFTSTSPIP